VVRVGVSHDHPLVEERCWLLRRVAAALGILEDEPAAIAHHASEGARLWRRVPRHRRAAERRADGQGPERAAVEISADLHRLRAGSRLGRAALFKQLQRKRLGTHGRAERVVPRGSARRRGHHAQLVLELAARKVHERGAEEIRHAPTVRYDDGPRGARVPQAGPEVHDG